MTSFLFTTGITNLSLESDRLQITGYVNGIKSSLLMKNSRTTTILTEFGVDLGMYSQHFNFFAAYE
jgi:hypothetical protein